MTIEYWVSLAGIALAASLALEWFIDAVANRTVQLIVSIALATFATWVHSRVMKWWKA